MKKVQWIPQHHRHAPPNYTEGMMVHICIGGVKYPMTSKPAWIAGSIYIVPEEATRPKSTCYATHVPKFRGDAPKNWKEGMWWSLTSAHNVDRLSDAPVFDSVGSTYYVPAEAVGPEPVTITQVELDALWLAARLTVNLPDVPEALTQRATARINELHYLNAIDFDNDGKAYVL